LRSGDGFGNSVANREESIEIWTPERFSPPSCLADSHDTALSARGSFEAMTSIDGTSVRICSDGRNSGRDQIEIEREVGSVNGALADGDGVVEPGDTLGRRLKDDALSNAVLGPRPLPR
jgi:hypothetical protein